MGLPRHRNPNCDPSRQPAKACRRCKLWPPMVEFRWSSYGRRWASWCASCTDGAANRRMSNSTRKASVNRYRQSEKGRATVAAWEATETARERRLRYRNTPRAKVLRGIGRERHRLKQPASKAAKESAKRRLRAYLAELARMDGKAQRRRAAS